MKQRVLSALEIYQEGGTVEDAVKKIGLAWSQFYKAVNSDPELKAKYLQIQENRADMYIDRLEKIPLEVEDVRRARVLVDALVNKAKFYNRARFGDKVDVSVTGTVSLAGALAEAKARAIPPRDPEKLIDAEYIDITNENNANATDTESGAAEAPAATGTAKPGGGGIFD